MKIKLKYYIVHKYKYSSMHWWELPFKSYLTDFSFPNTGALNDASRFMGGIYIEGWNYDESYAKLYDLNEAKKILDYLNSIDKEGLKYSKYYIKSRIYFVKE